MGQNSGHHCDLCEANLDEVPFAEQVSITTDEGEEYEICPQCLAKIFSNFNERFCRQTGCDLPPVPGNIT